MITFTVKQGSYKEDGDNIAEIPDRWQSWDSETQALTPTWSANEYFLEIGYYAYGCEGDGHYLATNLPPGTYIITEAE